MILDEYTMRVRVRNVVIRLFVLVHVGPLVPPAHEQQQVGATSWKTGKQPNAKKMQLKESKRPDAKAGMQFVGH
ncbi:ubiquitin-activating enzyme E1 Y-linked protein [Anopheles sinensis]|uniref:Ubiquitin-activating enzyme E1 Y-linked protein n=1 Tax=Anopheles sinensis TaxID=74873 RepID=A0A084WEC2_ANOSI|nr:ubiquitin-activating enzyme E1 Y-linked protein [Anopheles sinensis]